VIAIIGILVGLLLPAVQAARESARRLHCSNQLQQLALAAHNHHTTCNAFPPGVDRSTPQKSSLFVFLLPYLEGGSLYEQFAGQKAPCAQGPGTTSSRTPGTSPFG
jgi:type II secretory pathway pseudopilin PulG